MGCGASFLGVAKYRAAVLGARPVARPGDHDPRNYTIVGMLGRGDGARVYLCERHNRCPGEDHCAMKVPSPPISSRPRGRAEALQSQRKRVLLRLGA
jgi:hypothetical protein